MGQFEAIFGQEILNLKHSFPISII